MLVMLYINYSVSSKVTDLLFKEHNTVVVVFLRFLMFSLNVLNISLSKV